MNIRLPSPAIVIACIALLLAAGGTSMAAMNATGTAMNIVDPVTAAYKAKVDSSGKLLVNSSGTVVARSAAPVTPWANTGLAKQGNVIVLDGPRTSPINLTSLSMSFASNASDTDTASVFVIAGHVPSGASNCSGYITDGTIYAIPRLSGATPFSVSFPTPLQLKPPAGTKACLIAGVFSAVDVAVNGSGFVS